MVLPRFILRTVFATSAVLSAAVAAGGIPALAEEEPPKPPPPPASRSANVLNPALSVVLLATGAASRLGGDPGNGFDLSEVELAFQSVVDPYARVDLFVSIPAGESPEVEEGVITTLALPGPLQLKGGRFKNAVGKWNRWHTHEFPAVDAPDVLAHFFGEESLASDGLSLSVLVSNPWDHYIDATTEVGTARESGAFNSAERNLTYLEHLKWLFNATPNATLEFGATGAHGRTGPPEGLVEALAACAPCAGLVPRPSLDSTVAGLDVTYKWKPLRANVYKSFLWQAEWLRSRRDVDGLDLAAPALTPETVSASGGYTHVEWQLRKRWRVGTRFDLAGFPDSDTARSWAASAVMRFQPSEFQEIRVQARHTRRNSDAAARFDGEADDDRIFVQWIPAIGAHGAHKY